jgi:murein DD-endopeptidase MepM/ murein hydrolase activator NlpD
VAPGTVPPADLDLYPEPPFDPVTTPSAAQVQALYTALKRVQALQNAIATGVTRLAADRTALTAAEAALRNEAAHRDGLGRLLFIDRSERAELPDRPSPLELLGVDPAELRVKEFGRTMDEVRRGEAAVDAARRAMGRSTVELNNARAELAAQQAVAAALRALVDENARAAAAGGPAAAGRYSGGRLRPPVAGRLSSPFGNRFDPYYRVWQLHAGLDLAAAAGTPIRAAASGVVTRAGWFGGYGNYTCLAHGTVREQRLSTCYGHQSALLVRPGQRVDVGTVIGRVGSTGASTGPHLHFEVRLGGRPVDPRPWF